MNALGPLRRVLRSGMISGALLLAAIPAGALVSGSPDPVARVVLGPASNALGDNVVTDKGSVASGRGTDIEGDAYLRSTPAELKETIERTLSPVDLQSLVRKAARGAVLETDARVGELGAALDLRNEALARMFEMLGRQDVPPEGLADVLAEIVARYQSLLERVRLLEASDPRAAELRDAVAAAIETADYDRVHELLAGAEAIEFEALRQLLKALDQRVLNAAAIYPEAGDVAGTQLEYRAAQYGVLLHGADRAGFGGLQQFAPSGRFCQWYSGHSLCMRRADSSPRCDRLPNHPLCQDPDDDDFCRRHPDHKRCEQPPSPS